MGVYEKVIEYGTNRTQFGKSILGKFYLIQVTIISKFRISACPGENCQNYVKPAGLHSVRVSDFTNGQLLTGNNGPCGDV
jgi:hypothetical protein